MPDARDGQKLRSAAVVVAAATIGLLLAWPIAHGEVYVFDDLGDYFLPLRAFYARAIENGHGFLWFPDTFTGYYLHAEGAAALLHPFNWILYASLPLDLAFNLELLRSYPILFVGTFLLLRRWPISRDAALFGALIFTFSGFNLLHYLHLNAVATVAHIPWLLWATDLSLRGGTTRRVVLGRLCAALLVASALLHGYPQYLMFALLAQAVYVLLLGKLNWSWERICMLALLELCGLAAGGVQLLPTLAELPDSVRAARSLRFLNSFALEPINLVQLFGPYVFKFRVVGGNPHEWGLYAGAALPALCCWLWIRRRALGALRPLVVTAAVLAVLSLLLALGEFGQLYRLQLQLPLLNSFRAPSRYIVLVHFSLAILAAVAFQDLLRSARHTVRDWRSLRLLLLVPLLAVVAVVAAIASEASGAEPTATAASPFGLAISLALMFIGTGLAAASARGTRVAPLALIAFVALDQAAYGLGYVLWNPVQSIESFSDALDRPRGQPGERIRAQRNDPSLAGFRNVGGYSALPPKRALGKRLQEANELNAARVAGFRVSGVSWVRVPAWDRLDGLSNDWIPVDDPLPRARLVARSQVTTNLWRDLGVIDPRETALVSSVLDLPGGEIGEALLERDEPGFIQIATSAATRQLLIVSESYHRGWRATIDGEKAPLIRVYADFIGCVVPKGEHRVDLDFDPPSLRAGARLSLAGGVLALAFTTASLLRARRGL